MCFASRCRLRYKSSVGAGVIVLPSDVDMEDDDRNERTFHCKANLYENTAKIPPYRLHVSGVLTIVKLLSVSDTPPSKTYRSVLGWQMVPYSLEGQSHRQASRLGSMSAIWLFSC